MSTAKATLTIRELGARDERSLERLAALEGRRVPAGPLMGAEVEGRLLAAISLGDGETVADPFSRTDELVALLELRAGQLRQRRPRRRGRLLRRSAPAPAARLVGLHPRAS